MGTSPGCAVRAKTKSIAEPTLPFLIGAPNQISPDAAGDNPSVVADGLNGLLFQLGVEPSLTVHGAAAILRWSYWKARRYFSQVDGICVSFRPKRYKRPYRSFTIRSAFSHASGKR